MQHPSVVLPPSGSAYWDELALWWLGRYKASTQRTYAVYLPRWAEWCTARGVDPLTARRADVELWLLAVADSGLSRASVAAHYDTVASIYRLAYVEELIAANPCARVPRPKVHRQLQRREVLTVLEYAAYLTAARALGPTHHAIAVLGGMMGLRASEMAGLTVENLTSIRGYTTLTFIGKGDKPARMPCRCRLPVFVLLELDGVLVVAVDEQVHGRPAAQHDDGGNPRPGRRRPVSQGQSLQSLPLSIINPAPRPHRRRLEQ